MITENVIQIKSGIKINADGSIKIWKNTMSGKRVIFGILLHVVWENGKYLKTVIVTVPTKTVTLQPIFIFLWL